MTKTTVAEMELEDTCALANGFSMLWVGDVIGANLCFYPGMGASSTIVVCMSGYHKIQTSYDTHL